MKRRGILLAVSFLLVFGICLAAGLVSSRPVMAQAAPGNLPVLVSQTCSSLQPGKIVATFSWQPIGSGQQWLDISLFNNGFVSGTFLGIGPFPVGVNSFAWDGLVPGKRHEVRVNTLTPSGWQPTPVLSFMTGQCISGSSPIFYYLECSKTQPGTAEATFRWQPSGKGQQWLDISLGKSFEPDTFVGLGPFPLEANSFTWDGLILARMHYFRINTLTAGGWESSQLVPFFSGRCSSVDKTPIGGGNKIVLTFDDCGNPYGGTSKILDILAAYQVKAMFFPTGACIPMAPDVFDRVIAEGHLIGNHTYNHPQSPSMTHLSLDEVRHQIADGPPQARGGFWRPPGGDTNSTVDAIASELGYTLMMWDVDTNDWRGRSKDEIIGTVLSEVSPGSVVLMHVHAAHTPEALPTIIESLQAAGYILSW